MPVNFFCYPAGRYDDTVVAAVQAAGYLGATTTNYGLARPGDLYTLYRVRINGTDSISAFAQSSRRSTELEMALAGAGVFLLLLVGAGLGYYLYVQGKSGDIRGSSTVEFVPTEAPPTRPADARRRRTRSRRSRGADPRRLADVRLRRSPPALPAERPGAAVPDRLGVPRAAPARVSPRGRLSGAPTSRATPECSMRSRRRRAERAGGTCRAAAPPPRRRSRGAVYMAS